MPHRQPLESSWQTHLDVTLVPAVVRLPATVRVERRNTAARQALVSRVYGEFIEMPGLSLTLTQAARLNPHDTEDRGLRTRIERQQLRRLIADGDESIV
jgi:hypothetical protein